MSDRTRKLSEIEKLADDMQETTLGDADDPR